MTKLSYCIFHLLKHEIYQIGQYTEINSKQMIRYKYGMREENGYIHTKI